MTTTNINSKMQELKEYIALKDDIDAQIEALKDELKAHMVENELTELFNADKTIVARYTEVSSRRFNSTEFKKDFLDIYNEYCKLSTSMRFTIN